MPVVTRSCSKQKSRPRIEEETPATTNVVRRRYATRSSVKRKILQQENEVKDLEPPTKIAATKRSSRTSSNSPNNSSLKDISNITANQKENKGNNVKSGRSRTNRIPTRNIKENKRVLLNSSKKHINKENHQESQNADYRSPALNATCGDHEVISKTPAGCIAARIRSYSALRRSQCKKNNREWHYASDTVNGKSPLTSPLEEVSFNSRVREEGHDSDEDILWRMSRCPQTQEDEQNSDDEIIYKNKYFTLLDAMKQLQNTFLKAQKNAERNVKVSDTLVSELKSNLSLEKQKCSLLNEEVKIKKGGVERLRSDLENTKEQLQYMKEEKENREKQDREESEKKQNHSDKAISKNKATEALAVLNRDRDESFREQNYSNEAISKEKQLIEEQRSVINFYSRLTGVSLSCDNNAHFTSSFQSFNCTFFPDPNSAHGLQFRLTHDKEFDEIEYSPNPRSPGAEGVLKSLPDYLQENIFFGADQAPKFLTKLLKTAE